MPKNNTIIAPERSNSVGIARYAEAIAPSNPALAWAMLLAGDQIPQIFKLSARFVSGAIDEQVNGSTRTDTDDEGFCSDFIIVGCKFQIRRNNAFPGSIWKAQSDYFNAKNSGIDVLMKIDQCPKFDIVPNTMPIELVAQAADAEEGEMQFPYGFVAPKCSSIHAFFTNTRGFPPQDGPVDVITGFKGFSLGCSIETIDLSDALKGLASAGINVSDVIVNR